MFISSVFFPILIVFACFLKRGEMGVKLGRWGRIWKELGIGKLNILYNLRWEGPEERKKILSLSADCPISWQ